MRKILFILAILMLLVAVDARVPTVGDQVTLFVSTYRYDGTITDIADGFVCMNCTDMDANGKPQIHFDGGLDTCFGIGQIIALTWGTQ